MTSLVVWVGADSRGPASLYMASDSRASWGSRNAYLSWDFCRKLFILPGRPDVLGYAGPIVLVSHTLAGVVDQILTGYLPYPASPQARFDLVCSRLKVAHAAYPAQLLSPYSVLVRHARGRGYAGRLPCVLGLLDGCGVGNGAASRSAAIVASWRIRLRWASRHRLDRQLGRHDTGGRTSRSVFSGLCDAIASGADPLTGGAPQLAGIYRKGGAECLGIVWEGARYFMGHPDTLVAVDPSAVEWRNGLFERCDGATLDVLAGAQHRAGPAAPAVIAHRRHSKLEPSASLPQSTFQAAGRFRTRRAARGTAPPRLRAPSPASGVHPHGPARPSCSFLQPLPSRPAFSTNLNMGGVSFLPARAGRACVAVTRKGTPPFS